MDILSVSKVEPRKCERVACSDIGKFFSISYRSLSKLYTPSQQLATFHVQVDAFLLLVVCTAVLQQQLNTASLFTKMIIVIIAQVQKLRRKQDRPASRNSFCLTLGCSHSQNVFGKIQKHPQSCAFYSICFIHFPRFAHAEDDVPHRVQPLQTFLAR